MKKTVKIILKIFLIMLCAFIAFEIWGAISNAAYVHSQSKKVLEIAESNGGKIWDNYSWAGYNDLWEENFTGIIIIVYSENIDNISSSLNEKFIDNPFGVGVYPLKMIGWTHVDVPNYEPYWDKIDFETKHDKENYYVIGLCDDAPFKHNIISCIIFRITFKN